MTKHDFIFSDKLSRRVLRHLAFWMAFGLIFIIQSLGDPLSGFLNKGFVMRALECAFCFLPFCIISVYIFSNFLYPVFLEKKKYVLFITGFLLVVSLGVLVNYYATVLFFKLTHVNTLTREQKIVVGINFLWTAIVAGGLALGIKLAKNWYHQQNENFLLAKQKATTELKLLKARIHPDFLFGTLDDIYEKINCGSLKSPLMIMKLSELLSYLLYESDEELVPLERELAATNDFISISKLKMTDHPISLKMRGNTNNIFIAPLLLLTTLQNIFALLFTGKPQTLKTGITISIEGLFLMLILSLEYADKTCKDVNQLKSFVESEQRRLNLLYPENNCVLGLSHHDNCTEINLIISLNSKDLPAQNSNPNNLKKGII